MTRPGLYRLAEYGRRDEGADARSWGKPCDSGASRNLHSKALVLKRRSALSQNRPSRPVGGSATHLGPRQRPASHASPSTRGCGHTERWVTGRRPGGYQASTAEPSDHEPSSLIRAGSTLDPRGHIWPPTLPPAAFREACPYRSAISELKKEGILRRRCRHRPVQYLNNIVEQDHRAIKRRVKAKQGFREFQAARRTIQGYEAMHMIRKGQARWVSGSDVRRQIQFIHRLFEVAA